MKTILKVLKNIILWPFEHLVEIVIVAIILGSITTLQLRIFDIPGKYADKIWLNNIILAFLIYFISKRLTSNDKE